MVVKTATDERIFRHVGRRPIAPLRSRGGWAPAADLMAISLTSLASFHLVHHPLFGGIGVRTWHVLTDVLLAALWFVALSVRNVVPDGPDGTVRARNREWLGVLSVTAQLFGFVVLFRLISQLDVLDVGHLAVEVPLGLIGVIGTRSLLHRTSAVGQIVVPSYERALALPKVAFDVTFAAIAIALVAPVMIVIALAIKLTSRGPVFYVSERIGLNGTPFQMIKFRSMEVGADRAADAMIASADSGPVFFKVKSDPRVTSVGRIIRKYSLDELPQFFNVLFGDMSVVGPRPQVQREVDAYDHTMWRRLLVKPGVTGQWQVSGRSDLSAAESIQHDISYVDNWSMGLDIRIIAKTVGAVVRGDGAY